MGAGSVAGTALCIARSERVSRMPDSRTVDLPTTIRSAAAGPPARQPMPWKVPRRWSVAWMRACNGCVATVKPNRQKEAEGASNVPCISTDAAKPA